MQTVDQSVHEGKPVKTPNYEYQPCWGERNWIPIWVDQVDGRCYYRSGNRMRLRLSDLEKDPYYNVRPIGPKVEYHTIDLTEDAEKPTGGPSKYYDIPFADWTTTNDMVEFLSVTRWKEYSAHMKEILKALVRWGSKDGTTEAYDAKKVIYYGARILRMVSGNKAMRDYLQGLLDDKQFKE